MASKGKLNCLDEKDRQRIVPARSSPHARGGQRAPLYDSCGSLLVSVDLEILSHPPPLLVRHDRYFLLAHSYPHPEYQEAIPYEVL